jgi:hypothetical protein
LFQFPLRNNNNKNALFIKENFFLFQQRNIKQNLITEARFGFQRDRRCFVAHTQDLCFQSLTRQTCNWLILLPTFPFKQDSFCFSLSHLGLCREALGMPLRGEAGPNVIWPDEAPSLLSCPPEAWERVVEQKSQFCAKKLLVPALSHPLSLKAMVCLVSFLKPCPTTSQVSASVSTLWSLLS